MLAKILPAGSVKPFKAVQWPSVGPNVPAETGPVTSSSDHLQQAEISALRSELELVKAELENVRSDAGRQAEEALNLGRREGDAAVRQALEPQLEAEVGKLRQMMRDVIASAPKLRHHAEEDLVRLAVAIARRILHREVTIDSDAMTGLIKAAFARLDQREIHQIRTDPDTLSIVRKVIESANMARSVKVVADPSLKRGSLVIETPRGQLDASIETQLQEIQRGFTDVVIHS